MGTARVCCRIRAATRSSATSLADLLPNTGLNAQSVVAAGPDQENCDINMPRRRFFIEAWRIVDIAGEGASLRYHSKRNLETQTRASSCWPANRHRRTGQSIGRMPIRVHGPQSDGRRPIAAGAKQPEPLILRARPGECIVVVLTNMLGSKPEFELDHGGNGPWTPNGIRGPGAGT